MRNVIGRMLRAQFENSYRHPITGEPYGATTHALRWVSQLGLSDHEGLPITDAPEVFEKYGPRGVPNNPSFNLISNSGNHAHDQAALYLAQQALQNGRAYFQGGVLPPEIAVQAHEKLRENLEGKTAAWTEDRPKVPSEWDLIDERERDPMSPNWEQRKCPHCGKTMSARDWCNNCMRRIAAWEMPPLQQRDVQIPAQCPYCVLNGTTGETGCTCGYLRELELQQAKGKTADLRDPLVEPSWMANDGDIQDLNTQALCAKCGRPDCEHVMNHVHPPIHPKGMQVNPMWQDTSSPMDTHGTGM